jgi:hypothetical protein
MKRGAVMAYGADIMNAINDGLVNPMTLRALAGPISKSVRAPRSGGFATGGMISASQHVETGRASSPQQAMIVPDEKTMERMIAGGHPAMLRWAKNNASELSSIFSKARAT